jgi:hypothetical protein
MALPFEIEFFMQHGEECLVILRKRGDAAADSASRPD